tara:strand:- start:355 stop:711 length:357 start_codon:yes stop_codon:yes gene_type:complete
MEKLRTASLGERFDPERNLWRNVLIVALEDALGKHSRNHSFGISRDGHAKMAREYFTEPNRDFAMVCNFAGFDYEYIRMKATKYFNNRKKEQDEKENDMSKMHWERIYKSQRKSGLAK